jgi:DNA-binding transcriptional regulator LsrR (DeoR family)
MKLFSYWKFITGKLAPPTMSVKASCRKESRMTSKRDRDLILRIARMRFEERLPQRDIAQRLALSEATISRALKDAFELDLVEIKVRPPTDRNAQLERELAGRFGLQQTVVVESAGQTSSTLSILGRAVGEALALDLADGMTIGVGDGESAAAVAAGFPKLWLHDVEVVPLIGGVGQLHMASHPIEIARELANRLNGRCWQLPAPSVLPDAATTAQLRQAPAVADAFAAMKRCKIAFVGIGQIDAATSMISHGALTLAELDTVAAQGAAGMICGRAYDDHGVRIESDLDTRILAISFADFCALPSRWVIGIGQSKVAALRGAFVGGIVTACGTDESTARNLLATS